MNAPGLVETTPHSCIDSSAQVRAAILLVEDDDALREFLREALEEDGYAVVDTSSAERGLEWLRRCDFDAVLADYHLTSADGASMLAKAVNEGRLDGVPAFIVTGDEDAARDDFRVIRKPIDTEGLLETLRVAIDVATERRRRSPKRAERATSNDVGANGHRPSPDKPIELTLYISSASIHSNAAVRNLQEALKQFNGPPVKLKVHDLAKDPRPKDAGNIVFTPALMSQGSGRRTWIVGNLQNPRLVLELLDSSIDRRS